MSHPAPSNVDPIRLTPTRSHREVRNLLIRSVLEPNFMPCEPGVKKRRSKKFLFMSTPRQVLRNRVVSEAVELNCMPCLASGGVQAKPTYTIDLKRIHRVGS